MCEECSRNDTLIGVKNMNTEFLNNYSKELLSKRDELLHLLSNQIARIELPSQDSSNLPTPVERTNHLPPYVSAAGAVLFVVGLCSKSTFVSVLGVLAVGTGALLWYKDKNINASKTVQKPNYTVLSSQINDVIRNIHSMISSDWDSFLSKQVSGIKSNISSLNLSEDQNNRVNDLLMTHSLISYPIMDVLPRLMAIARTGNVNEYSNHIYSFKEQYSKEISTAYLQQEICYKNIANILNN